MAEVTAFRNNALPYPVYGVPWVVVFPLLDADGDPVTGATCDSEVSLNGDTGVDCTNEGVEITYTTATNKGMYYLILTAAEMTADIVSVTVYSATSKATCITLYPRKLVALLAGTSAGGAVGYITLPAAGGANDDTWNGCLCVATIDSNVEARVIADYTGSTKQAAVTPSWNVEPDADDTFIIYLPEGMQRPVVDVAAISGDTTAADNCELMFDGTGYAGGTIVFQSDLTKIHGTAITETATQLAGAFTKFFDVAAPTGTVNSIPDAVAGAAGGLLIAGSNAGTTTFSALTVTNATTLTGAVALGSTLDVTGATTLASLGITGALTTGSITNNGTLTQTGAATFSSTLAAGAVTLSALTVTNATTLTGAVSLGSTLGVTGAVTLSSTFATGAVTLSALTVTNATTLTGAVSLGSTLGVTGAVTFSSTFATGAVTLSGLAITNALSVGTTTTLTGAVSLGSTLGVTGATTFTGAVGLSSTLTVAGALSLGPTTLTGAALTAALTIDAGEGTAAIALASGGFGMVWDTDTSGEFSDATVMNAIRSDATLIITQGDSAWTTATGFAVPSDVSDVATATIVRSDATLILTQGDSAWATATGFAVPSDVSDLATATIVRSDMTATIAAMLSSDTIAQAVLTISASDVQDTAAAHSLTATILAGLESSVSGVTWTIRKTDGTTFTTKTVTSDAAAVPITGVT